LYNTRAAQVGQSFKVVGDAEVELPEDERLGVTERSVGDGIEAVKGDEVTVAYVGTLAADGHQFDAADTYDFTVGAGDVIKGTSPAPFLVCRLAADCPRAEPDRCGEGRWGLWGYIG
jgi:hypothetical protein